MLILNKDFIQNNNMILEHKGHNIYMIYNFLDDKEREALMFLAFKKTDEEWKSIYKKRGVQDKLFDDKKILFDWADLEETISVSIREKWHNIFVNDNQESMDEYIWDYHLFIERRYSGSYTPIHIDRRNKPKLKYTTVLYLNDDFNGGEIFFPDIDVSIKPLKGSLCVFSAEPRLQHGVSEVTLGTRYFIPLFISDK